MLATDGSPQIKVERPGMQPSNNDKLAWYHNASKKVLRDISGAVIQVLRSSGTKLEVVYTSAALVNLSNLYHCMLRHRKIKQNTALHTFHKVVEGACVGGVDHCKDPRVMALAGMGCTN